MMNNAVKINKFHKSSRDMSVEYSQAREKKDKFPDASVLEPFDADKTLEIENGIQKMIKEAAKN